MRNNDHKNANPSVIVKEKQSKKVNINVEKVDRDVDLKKKLKLPLIKDAMKNWKDNNDDDRPLTSLRERIIK